MHYIIQQYDNQFGTWSILHSNENLYPIKKEWDELMLFFIKNQFKIKDDKELFNSDASIQLCAQFKMVWGCPKCNFLMPIHYRFIKGEL